jgi:hypothetical protein
MMHKRDFHSIFLCKLKLDHTASKLAEKINTAFRESLSKNAPSNVGLQDFGIGMREQEREGRGHDGLLGNDVLKTTMESNPRITRNLQ